MAEPDGVVTESRSSFKLTTNAKGDVQVDVKTYALGPTVAEENDARERAIAHFDALRERYGAYE